MNGETLTYDEIVERSRKYLEKKEKKALIAFIIMGIIIFVFVCNSRTIISRNSCI